MKKIVMRKHGSVTFGLIVAKTALIDRISMLTCFKNMSEVCLHRKGNNMLVKEDEEVGDPRAPTMDVVGRTRIADR